MRRFLNSCFDNYRAVILVLSFFIVAGTVAFRTMPKESAPDVSIPIISVNVRLEGISPTDSERLILKPLEQKLRSIEGIKEMRGIAYEGGGDVVLEFSAGFKPAKALRDVRDKVEDTTNELPTDADRPTVNELNVSLFPILVITLSGNVPKRTLYRKARDIQDAIESIPTVLEANIVGDQEEAVEITVDPTKLEGFKLSALEVLGTFQRNNRLVPAGFIDNGAGRLSIKVPGLIENLQDLYNVPLMQANDAVVRVKDIANIKSTFKDPEGYARNNGNTAVSIEVSKRTGENILETVDAVKKIVNLTRERWPNVIKVDYSQDESKNIRNMLSDLENNVVAAVLLVVAVMVLSMGAQSSLLVGISVPGSFLMGVYVISLMGYTLNIVVLFSLILAVGILVDGAIIVVEYADRKIIDGASYREAYLEAAERMMWPVFSSTATILVVFFPLMFWPGFVGQFMKFLPITLVAVLTASFFMAILFIPTIGALTDRLGLKPSLKHFETTLAVERGELHKLKGMTKYYVDVLGKALDKPWKTIGLSLLILIVTVSVYKRLGKGLEFFPNVEPDQLMVKVKARGNYSLDEKLALVKQVEEKILPLQSDIESVYANTSLGRGNRKRPSRKPQQITEDTIGLITLELADWQKRRSAAEISADIEKRTSNLAGLFVEVERQKKGPPTGKPVQVQISSDYPDKLETCFQAIREKVFAHPKLMNAEDNAPLPGYEWVVRVDRAEALKYGADVASVGGAIRLITTGAKISTYRPYSSRDEVDIILRLEKPYRNLDQLNQLKIKTNEGLIPISHFVKTGPSRRVNTLYRVDGKRSLTVKADVKAGVLADDVIREFAGWIHTQNFDGDVKIQFKGDQKEQKETGAFLANAFLTAICGMAILLVLQFNSFFSMGLILSAILMSTIGVFVGLLVMNLAFSVVMCGIGVIALAGMIVSNNILILDTFDILKKEKRSLRDTLLITGAQRLRPVFLTQLTTALGLLPIMLRVNIDFLGREITFNAPSSHWWVQLSTAIVFGIVFASPLTLLVTPCALYLKNRKSWDATTA